MAYSLLIKNCGQILTMKGVGLGLVKNGFIACEGDKIVKVGSMKQLKRSQVATKIKILDAEGKVVMPGLIDCHTHLIFAGDRSHELKMKLEGKSYLEILASGGGILSTVKATRRASKAELVKRAIGHLNDFLKYGVTTVEAKSGYGLDKKNELKMLDAANEAGKKSKIRVVSTFLGAHVVPSEYKGQSDAYLKFLMEEMLPEVKDKAAFVDIFCEKGAFTLRQAKKYFKKAAEMGFGLKIHAEQMNRLGGCRLAARVGAVSCDHCDRISRGDIKKMAASSIVAVLLPTVPLYTRENIYANGRAMIDAGVKVAVSTDFNPGSSPVKNIYLAMSLACLKMGLTPEEALRGVTINAAAALNLEKEIGSIERGKIADIAIMNLKDYLEIPYWMGENLCLKVVKNGELV